MVISGWAVASAWDKFLWHWEYAHRDPHDKLGDVKGKKRLREQKIEEQKCHTEIESQIPPKNFLSSMKWLLLSPKERDRHLAF